MKKGLRRLHQAVVRPGKRHVRRTKDRPDEEGIEIRRLAGTQLLQKRVEAPRTDLMKKGLRHVEVLGQLKRAVMMLVRLETALPKEQQRELETLIQQCCKVVYRLQLLQSRAEAACPVCKRCSRVSRFKCHGPS